MKKRYKIMFDVSTIARIEASNEEEALSIFVRDIKKYVKIREFVGGVTFFK